jgi:hypothetical protein
MALSDFTIDQLGLAPGAPGAARRDLLPTSVAGGPVTLAAVTGGLTYKWEVTQTPGSVVPLTGATSQTCTIPAEIEGGYIAHLTVNEGLPTESISELYFGIGIFINGTRYALPALTETIEDNSISHPEYGWLDKILAIFRALSAGIVTGIEWSGDTASDVPQEIFVGGVALSREIVPVNASTAYTLVITSLDDSQVYSKTWRVECTVIRNFADVTTLVDIPVITILSQTSVSGSGTGTDLWDVAVTVDDADESLVVTVTGGHLTNIGWKAKASAVSAVKLNVA